MSTRSPIRTRFLHIFWLALLIVADLLCVLKAGAQEPPAPLEGVALSRFEPAERGSRFFLADSLELRAGDLGVSRPRISVGMPASYAFKATTFGNRREGERSTLSEGALYLHPGASIVLNPGARFAVDVPLAVAQGGENTNLSGKYYLAPAGPRLGDVRASFDLRIVGPSSRDVDGIALAGGVSLWLPTGSTVDFAGDEGTRFGVHATSAARLGWLLASARAAYMYRREGLIGGSFVGSEVSTVVGAGWADDVWTIGPELTASTALSAAFAKRTTPVEVLAGVHRSIGAFRFGLGVGTLLAKGMGAARARGVVSIEWIPALAGAEDRDRDGVPDDEDACPDVFGLKDGVPIETRGCPTPPSDRDHDGVPDNEDACPDLAGPRSSSDPKAHGCPDSDHDGIPDPVDACPMARGEPSANPKLNGCPLDRDGDGVLDSQDACPDVPGVPTDNLETNGCPPATPRDVP